MNYKKIYDALISFRRRSPLVKSKETYTELHHILPECMGGDYSKGNLIRLTGREHFIAHRLLSKIYPECVGVQVAVWGMMNTRSGAKVCSSREFDRLKTEFSKFISDHNRLAHLTNPELKRSQSKTMKRKYQEDPELRKKNSRGQTKRFSDPGKREEMSRALKGYYNRNPEAKDLISKDRKRFFENNPQALKEKSEFMKEFVRLNQPRPWMNHNAQRTRKIWSLARLFFDENISAAKFSEIYNEGNNLNIFDKMKTMIRKQGWNPNTDEIWLSEFDHFGFK